MDNYESFRKVSFFVLKYVIAAAIIYWLMHHDILNFDFLRTISMDQIMIGLTMVLVIVGLASLRLKLLLHDRNINLSLKKCFMFNCLGIFYALFLPGGISGDAARAYYLIRDVGYNRAAILGSLVLDRVFGSFAMVGLGLVSSAFLVSSIPGIFPYFLMASILFFVGGAVVCFLLVTDLKLKEKKSGNIIRRLYEFIHNIFVRIDLSGHSNKTLAYTLILSVVVHVVTIFLIFICSVHNQSGLSFMEVFSVGPFGLLINAIPITPGGLGVGEKGFDYLYGLIGGENGASSFLMARLFIYSPALLGGAVAAYYFFPLHKVASLISFMKK